MARANDVGGVTGFGPVVPDEGSGPFQADWEARVHALQAVLRGRGAWTADEFRDAVERLPPAVYLTSTTYERWFAATCTLLVEKGLVTAEDLP